MGLRSKKSRLDQATDIVEGYVDSVRPHVTAAFETAMESARDFVQDTALPALNDARDKAGPAIADAREKAAPVMAEARVRAAEHLADAREKATPVVANARVRAAEHLADAREKAAPVVAAGAAAASERATAARVLADTKVAEIKGEEPKKKGKLKRFVLLGALAGGVAVVAKKLQGSSTSDNWQSSYVPTPAPAAKAAPATSSVEDAGGSSPDEA
ncbi:MAG: hypothetical protein WB471_07060, partial [Nocardioides sp.]